MTSEQIAARWSGFNNLLPALAVVALAESEPGEIRW
jgi:hypothetical protein